jgi:hypothetical protein
MDEHTLIDHLIPRAEVPEYLRRRWGLTYSISTIERWASTGGGPPFMKAGPRRCIYLTSSLDQWAATRIGEERTRANEPG